MKIKYKWFGIIGIIIFIYLLSRTDLKLLWYTILNIKLIWTIPAIFFLFITEIITSARWKYISNKIGISLNLKDASIMRFKAMFAENSPGKIGEVFVRATYLKKKYKTSLSKALFSTTFSRFVDIWVTAIEGIIAIFFLAFIFGLKASTIIPTLIVLILVITIFFLIKNEKITRKILRPTYRFFISKEKLDNFDVRFENFYQEFNKMNMKVLIVSLIYDLFALLTVAVSFYFIALSLHVNFPIYLAILGEPLLTVVVALPISFSGLGAREAVFAFLFSLIGISIATAIAFSIILFFIKSLMMIPGIIINLFEKN